MIEYSEGKGKSSGGKQIVLLQSRGSIVVEKSFE
jgi:hypothetical protein